MCVGEQLKGGTAAFVARARTASGTSVVVKVAVPDAGFSRQVRALALADSHGYVRLLAHHPGVVGKAGGQAAGLHELIARLWGELGRPGPEPVLARALECAAQRSAAFDVDRAVIVHGVAASANLLHVPGPRRGADAWFVFVDPDTFLGDPAYDLGAALREWCRELLAAGDAPALARRWCRLLASACGVEETADWQWGYLERVSGTPSPPVPRMVGFRHEPGRLDAWQPELVTVTVSQGVELHVDVVGNGPPILWLPGGPGLNNYLHPVARALTDFRNVLPDPRGTGRSQGEPHNLDVAIRDLEDLRRHLDLERWDVVGHSWGADLALAYGLQHGGSVASIISFAGTGIQNDRDWHAAYEARCQEEPHGTYQHSPEVQSQLIQDWRRFIKSPDLLARVSRLEVPITFLHSTKDIRPGWPAQQLAQLVPQGYFRELADAPHEAWLTHHDALIHVLRDILAATVCARQVNRRDGDKGVGVGFPGPARPGSSTAGVPADR